MTEVRLERLSKTYPGTARPAVEGVTLDLAAGELVALLGPSGCGKTTVLKMIAGLVPASSGRVLFDAASVGDLRAEARDAVMVFQSHLLFPYMSVAENVGFGLKMRHAARAEIAARVEEMLDLVQLPGLAGRRPHQLSAGQQQRVALARALVVRPKVLLLDEPLSNLDAHLRLEMRDLIAGLQRRLRITTLLVTHDQEEAVAMADRIALMLAGRVVQHGAPSAFYDRPADLAVARFFGGRNFVPGVAVSGVFQSVLGPLRLPDSVADGPGTLTFRPENVRVGAPQDGNSFALRLVGKTYLGTQSRLLGMAGDQPIEVMLNPAEAAALAEGTQVRASVAPEALWVLRG